MSAVLCNTSVFAKCNQDNGNCTANGEVFAGNDCLVCRKITMHSVVADFAMKDTGHKEKIQDIL